MLTVPFLDSDMATKERGFSPRGTTFAPSATFLPRALPTPDRTFTRANVREREKRPSPARTLAVDGCPRHQLFLVVETPRYVFSAESRCESEDAITDACGGDGPLPFLLKGSTLYTLSPLTASSVLAPALKVECAPGREKFEDWLLDEGRSQWATDLLNHFLRRHAWQRGLRFDQGHGLFYFSRSKPKRLFWEEDGKIALREVTAPHMKRYDLEDYREIEYQCGWKHEAVQAGFVRCGRELALKLSPAWFLTELDGRTAAVEELVAPLDSCRFNHDGMELSRTLRFWSAIFAKGHRELRIQTGAEPIRVRLTSPSSGTPRIISREDGALDYVALTSMEDDGPIPELGPVGC